MKKLITGLFVGMVATCVLATDMNWQALPGSVAVPGGADASSWIIALYVDGGDMAIGDGGAGIDFGPGGVSLGDEGAPVVTSFNVGGAASIFWYVPSTTVPDGSHIFTAVFSETSLGNIDSDTQYVIVDDALFGPTPNTDPPNSPIDYNAGSAAAGDWQQVPEPSSLALMGLGAVALVVRRFRKK